MGRSHRRLKKSILAFYLRPIKVKLWCLVALINLLGITGKNSLLFACSWSYIDCNISFSKVALHKLDEKCSETSSASIMLCHELCFVQNKTTEKRGLQQKKIFFPLWFNLHFFINISAFWSNAPFLTSGVDRLSHWKSWRQLCCFYPSSFLRAQ